MSSDAAPRLGTTPPTTPPDDMTAATAAGVTGLVSARQPQTRTATWSPVGMGRMGDEPHSGDEHGPGRPSGPVAEAQTDAHVPDSEIAIIVQREFAVTVRASAARVAQPLAEAIGRVLQALVTPGGPRCRIEATSRNADLPSLVIECPTGDARTLDTLMRCLESIVGAALRAKVVTRDGTRARIRTWVGAWIEPERPTPHPRPLRPRVRPSAPPAAA